jgi:hypothetical protein
MSRRRRKDSKTKPLVNQENVDIIVKMIVKFKESNTMDPATHWVQISKFTTAEQSAAKAKYDLLTKVTTPAEKPKTNYVLRQEAHLKKLLDPTRKRPIELSPTPPNNFTLLSKRMSPKLDKKQVNFSDLIPPLISPKIKHTSISDTIKNTMSQTKPHEKQKTTSSCAPLTREEAYDIAYGRSPPISR